MTSSDDGSNESDLPKGAKILDLRDRLPPVISGDNPSGNLAVALLKTIIEHDEGAPHVWFAGLMMTSYALQRLLSNGWGVDTEKMRVIFAKAMEIAEGTQINIDFKNLKPKG